MSKSKKIDEYLKVFSIQQKKQLQAIRQTVHELVPEVEEDVRYGVPTFRYKDKNMLHFAAFKDHMSLFPGPSVIEKLKPKLEKYKIAKGTIQFTLDNPIPDSLLKEIIFGCKEKIENK